MLLTRKEGGHVSLVYEKEPDLFRISNPHLCPSVSPSLPATNARSPLVNVVSIQTPSPSNYQ